MCGFFLWAFYIVSLVYISGFVSVPYSLDDYSFVLWSEVRAMVHRGAKCWTRLKQLQFSSVTQSCLTLFHPMDCTAHQASLSFTIFQSLLKLMSIELVMPSSHLVHCWPLLLLPSIFPSIRVFYKESAFHIRWPKYWSFSFSISLPLNI